jgi:hypothetical protein
MRSFDSRDLFGSCITLALAEHLFPCGLRHHGVSIHARCSHLNGSQLDPLDSRHLVPGATIE